MKEKHFYVTVGPSASGKSYYSENLVKNSDFVNINNDDLRRSLFQINHWEEYDFDKYESLITKIRKDIILNSLQEDRNVIISNLNISLSNLKYYFELAKKYGYNFKVILFDVSLSTCLSRNSKRTYMKLKDSIIVDQYQRFSKIIDNIKELYEYELIGE